MHINDFCKISNFLIKYKFYIKFLGQKFKEKFLGQNFR